MAETTDTQNTEQVLKNARGTTGRVWLVHGGDVWRGTQKHLRKLYVAIAKNQKWDLATIGFERMTGGLINPSAITREDAITELVESI